MSHALARIGWSLRATLTIVVAVVVTACGGPRDSPGSTEPAADGAEGPVVNSRIVDHRVRLFGEAEVGEGPLTGRLEGRVVDESGEPLAGAVVRVTGPPGGFQRMTGEHLTAGVAVAGPDGRYAVRRLAAGIGLYASAGLPRGAWTAPRAFHLVEPGDVARFDFEVPAAGRGVRATLSAPPDVDSVALSWDGDTFPGSIDVPLRQGRALVRFGSGDGHETELELVANAVGCRATRVTIPTPTDDFTVRAVGVELVAGGRPGFGLVLGIDGRPRGDAEIRHVSGRELARTDAEGRFAIGRELGAEPIVARVPGEGVSDPLELTEDVGAVVLRLRPGARVEGTVRDEAGRAAAGLLVWSDQPVDLVATTDEEGRYAFDALLPGWPIDQLIPPETLDHRYAGPWESDSRPPRFVPATRDEVAVRDVDVRRRPGEIASFTIEIPDDDPPSPLRVEHRVGDDEHVHMVPAVGRSTTFEMLLSPGAHRVGVTAGRFDGISEEIRIDEGADPPAPITIRLRERPRVTLRLTEGGKPTARRGVRLTVHAGWRRAPPDPWSRVPEFAFLRGSVVRTDARGEADLTELVPPSYALEDVDDDPLVIVSLGGLGAFEAYALGPYAVRVAGSDLRTARDRRTGRHVIEVPFRTHVTVAVRATTRTGEPVAGVRLTSPTSSLVGTDYVTDDDGRVILRLRHDPTLGSYDGGPSIWAEFPWRGSVLFPSIGERGEPRFEVHRVRRYRLRVIDERGRPIPGLPLLLGIGDPDPIRTNAEGIATTTLPESDHWIAMDVHVEGRGVAPFRLQPDETERTIVATPTRPLAVRMELPDGLAPDARILCVLVEPGTAAQQWDDARRTGDRRATWTTDARRMLLELQLVAADTPFGANVEVPPDATSIDVPRSAWKSVAVALRLVDAEGTPLAGRRVRVSCGVISSEPYDGRTDDDGVLRFEMPPGVHDDVSILVFGVGRADVSLRAPSEGIRTITFSDDD